MPFEKVNRRINHANFTVFIYRHPFQFMADFIKMNVKWIHTWILFLYKCWCYIKLCDLIFVHRTHQSRLTYKRIFESLIEFVVYSVHTIYRKHTWKNIKIRLSVWSTIFSWWSNFCLHIILWTLWPLLPYHGVQKRKLPVQIGKRSSLGIPS